MPHRVEHSTGNLMKSSVSSVAVGVPRARQQEAPSLKYWLLRRAIRARQPRVLLRTNMYSCGRTGGRAGPLRTACLQSRCWGRVRPTCTRGRNGLATQIQQTSTRVPTRSASILSLPPASDEHNSNELQIKCNRDKKTRTSRTSRRQERRSLSRMWRRAAVPRGRSSRLPLGMTVQEITGL